jgi:hypothetical protein
MKNYLRECKAEKYGKKPPLHDLKVTNIFLICDRDELPAANIHAESGVKVIGVDYPDKYNIGSPCPEKMNIHLLTWKRREIENYLLSYSALTHFELIDAINSDQLAQGFHLREGDSGDNDGIRMLDVKHIVNPLIETSGIGKDLTKIESYISHMKPEEISEDITNMYNFIIGKL